MADDIVTRLQMEIDFDGDDPLPLLVDAKAEIERLRARVDYLEHARHGYARAGAFLAHELRQALTPVSRHADVVRDPLADEGRLRSIMSMYDALVAPWKEARRG